MLPQITSLGLPGASTARRGTDSGGGRVPEVAASALPRQMKKVHFVERDKILAMFAIIPKAVCDCGTHRRFFQNRVGLRIWRCPNCEDELLDILVFLQFMSWSLITDADQQFLKACGIAPEI